MTSAFQEPFSAVYFLLEDQRQCLGWNANDPVTANREILSPCALVTVYDQLQNFRCFPLYSILYFHTYIIAEARCPILVNTATNIHVTQSGLLLAQRSENPVLPSEFRYDLNCDEFRTRIIQYRWGW